MFVLELLLSLVVMLLLFISISIDNLVTMVKDFIDDKKRREKYGRR